VLTLVLVPAYFSIAISIESRAAKLFHRLIGAGAHEASPTGTEPLPAE
jgi:hypothetical protein